MSGLYWVLAGAALAHGLLRQDEISILQALLFVILAKLASIDKRP